LQKLKRDAESYLGEDIADAVITVPAYFTTLSVRRPRRRQIAGLNVLRIVNERLPRPWPTPGQGRERTDHPGLRLGGGTFDVSLLEIGEGVVEVRATSGDNHLGGDDWDQRVVDWLVEKFKAPAVST